MREEVFGSNLEDDTLIATDTIRETFYGQGGDDTFYFYNGSNPFFDQDFSDRFIGGTGDDLMTGLDVGFNDYDEYALLSFDGGAGYDSVKYAVTDALSDGDAISMDLSKFKTDEISVEHHAFDIAATVEDGAAASFSVLGTSGDETVRLELDPARSQNLTSTITVDVDLDAGDDRFEFVGQRRIDTVLEVSTGKGKDTVIINDTTTENSSVSNSMIKTGNGKDTVVLEGMHKETAKLGGGDDKIYILTGSFADRPDAISTGSGADRIYLELDSYSHIAKIKDFDAENDTLVFDADESRDTDVTFDADVADAASDPMLYMDNAAGELWFGDNLMATFTNGVVLSEANFTTDDFLF